MAAYDPDASHAPARLVSAAPRRDRRRAWAGRAWCSRVPRVALPGQPATRSAARTPGPRPVLAECRADPVLRAVRLLVVPGVCARDCDEGHAAGREQVRAAADRADRAGLLRVRPRVLRALRRRWPDRHPAGAARAAGVRRVRAELLPGHADAAQPGAVDAVGRG